MHCRRLLGVEKQHVHSLHTASCAAPLRRRDEATRIYKRRSLAEEAALAGAASVLLGLGSFFLLLWTGVYVG